MSFLHCVHEFYHDSVCISFLVIQLGFIGEAERTVVEGEGLRICAELQTSDFVRFDNQYAISTSDGSAIGRSWH